MLALFAYISRSDSTEFTCVATDFTFTIYLFIYYVDLFVLECFIMMAE